MAIQAQLADGRVLEFPDGTDPSVIDRTVQSLISSAPQSTERTWGESVTDLGSSLKQGLGGLMQFPGQMYGLATGAISKPDFADTGLYGVGKRMEESAQQGKSESLKAREAASQERVAEADKEGFWSGAGQQLKEIATDPVQLPNFLLSQSVQSIPSILAALIPVVGPAASAELKGLQIAAKAATAVGNELAKKEAIKAMQEIAIKAGTRQAIGVGALQQGADIGSGTYEDAYKKLIADGVPQPEAASKAVNLAREAGASGAVISLLVNKFMPGASAMEKAIAGKTAGVTGRGRAALAIGAKEALTSEPPEEVGGRMSRNAAMMQIDPNQTLMEGTGSTAGQAIIGGFGLGAMTGAATGNKRPEDEKVKTPEELKAIKAQEDFDKQRAEFTAKADAEQAAEEAKTQQAAKEAADKIEAERLQRESTSKNLGVNTTLALPAPSERVETTPAGITQAQYDTVLKALKQEDTTGMTPDQVTTRIHDLLKDTYGTEAVKAVEAKPQEAQAPAAVAPTAPVTAPPVPPVKPVKPVRAEGWDKDATVVNQLAQQLGIPTETTQKVAGKPTVTQAEGQHSPSDVMNILVDAGSSSGAKTDYGNSGTLQAMKQAGVLATHGEMAVKGLQLQADIGNSSDPQALIDSILGKKIVSKEAPGATTEAKVAVPQTALIKQIKAADVVAHNANLQKYKVENDAFKQSQEAAKAEQKATAKAERATAQAAKEAAAVETKRVAAEQAQAKIDADAQAAQRLEHAQNVYTQAEQEGHLAEKPPTGFDIKREAFKEGEAPGVFEIKIGDTVIPFEGTEAEANAKVARLQNVRDAEAAKLQKQVDEGSTPATQKQTQIEQMEAMGKHGTPEHTQAVAEHKRLLTQANLNNTEVSTKLFDLTRTPITLSTVGNKPLTREGHTVYEGDKAKATLPTRKAAEEHILTNASEEQINTLAASAHPWADRAKEEVKRRKATDKETGKVDESVYPRTRGNKTQIVEAPARPEPVDKTDLPKSGGETLWDARVDELNAILKPLLKKLGLENVGLDIVSAIKNGADGSYAAKLIKIAFDTTTPIRTLRHEGIHALKELGFFSDQQWKALEDRAKKVWVNQYLKGVVQGEGQTRYDAYVEMGLTEQEILEEAIADAFADFDATKAPPGMIAAILNRMRLLINHLKSAFTGAGYDNFADVFGKVERGELKAGKEAVPGEEKLSLKTSPLAPYVAKAEADARMQRRENRAEGVGSPVNERTVLGEGKGKLVVGKVTHQDWVDRVKNLLSTDEIKDARIWYSQLHDALVPIYGEDSPKIALAWLLSQNNASPTQGFMNVLRASDMVAGKKQIKIAGLNHQALIDVLSGKMPTTGIGPKLFDFSDSELGKLERTWMKDNPKGKQPAAIDVWAQRDVGFIDDTTLEFIRKKFGEEAANALKVDKTTRGEAQYEHGIDFYNDVKDLLNKQNFMGGGWTAPQIQAVGWVTMQRAMGIQAEFVRDIINGNTRRISIGLAPGSDSAMSVALMGREIPKSAAQKVIKDLADLAGVKILQSVEGAGAYLTYVEGSIQIDALASPEAVADFMDMIGFAFQQTEVINTRPLKSGKNMAIDIMSADLASVGQTTKFFGDLLENMPTHKKYVDEGNTKGLLAPGFQQITIDGVPGIRLLNFGGKWNENEVFLLGRALKTTADTLNVKVSDSAIRNVVLSSTKNDWKGNRDGQRYIASLNDRGRVQEAQLLQRRYAPSRFDLAGDGTIGWGKERYSLRPTEPTGRPDDIGGRERGITLGTKQPGSISFSGVHYGKIKTDTLLGSKWGTGLQGAEARRLERGWDERIKKRVYFYIPKHDGTMPAVESGVGGHVYTQTFNNIISPAELSKLYSKVGGDANRMESAVIDAGYDGYAAPSMGMMVILNHDVPVEYQGNKAEYESRKEKLSLRSVGLTDKRIENLLGIFSYNDGRTHGMLAFVNPSNFVKATTHNAEYAKRIAEEAGDLNKENITAEGQTPFFFWDAEKDEIVGHEGRHRMAALAKEGVTKAPVVLWVKDRYGSKMVAHHEARDTVTMSGEKFSFGKGSRVTVEQLTPINWESKSELQDKFGKGDFKFSLRAQVEALPNGAQINTRVGETTYAREEKSHAKRMIEALTPRSFSSFRQKALHRYNQAGVVGKQAAQVMGDRLLLADASAEAACLFSDNASSLAAEAMGVGRRKGGIPQYIKGTFQAPDANGVMKTYESGYFTVDNSSKGAVEIFAPLAAKGDPIVYQYYNFWAGVQRGSRFMADGTEQNFTRADIAYAKQLETLHPEFASVQKEWIKYNDGLVKMMVDAGVLTKEAGHEFTKHGDYLPFYRQLDGEATIGPNIFQSIAGVKPPKKHTGKTDAPIGDFLENVVRNTQAAIEASMKNVAGQRVLRDAETIGQAHKVHHNTKMGIDIVPVFENGVRTLYQVHDALLIEAMKGLNLPQIPFLGIVSAPANLLRTMVTKDPAFMLANMMRDSLSAWVTSGASMMPMVETIANFGKGLAGMSPEVDALRRAGILGGYDFAGNVETSGREFSAAMRKFTGTKTKFEKGVTPITGVWHALEMASDASEGATRAAVYKATLAKTGNEAEALFQAMEVLNFNRKGNSAAIRLLTAAVPFLNARMQGLDLLYRAGFGQLANADAKSIQKAFFVRGATIMAMSALYYAMTQDDDDYKEQEQETRDNYWLLPSLGVKIPIPFEVGIIFKVIPERILAYIFGSDTGKDFMDSMGRQIRSTLSINYPQIAVPYTEMVTNYSFFTGRPIVSRAMEGIAPEFQVEASTSGLAKRIGKGVGLSPIQIDHLISGYTGTMGMYMVNAMNSIFDTQDDPTRADLRFEQLPVFKRFLLDKNAKGNVTAYYDLKHSTDEMTRTVNMLERTGNYEEMAKYQTENVKLLATQDYIKVLAKEMKQFQDMKMQVQSSKMDGQSKRDTLTAINQAEITLTANIQTLKKMMDQMNR
jgi:hypothetical protein